MRRHQPKADYWFEDYGYAPSGPGSVHDLGGTKASEPPVAVLWVPDPEQRHGWREFYVSAPKQASERAPLGFKSGGKGG